MKIVINRFIKVIAFLYLIKKQNWLEICKPVTDAEVVVICHNTNMSIMVFVLNVEVEELSNKQV